MRGRGGGVGRRMTSSVVIVQLALLSVCAACWLRWGRMTSIWDIFQSSGLLESTTLSWRGRERTERVTEIETEREKTQRTEEEEEGEWTEI